MLRVFIGIRLPPEHCLSLSLICAGLHGAKWVDPGNFHVTIRFVGEIEEGVAEDIHHALSTLRLPAFPLTIAGLGTFSTQSALRAVYAGVERSDSLLHLQTKVESLLARLGLPPDGRRFTPHVTLARFQRGDLAEGERFVVAHNLLRLPAFTVDRLCLIASYPTKSGAIYENVAEYKLR